MEAEKITIHQALCGQNERREWDLLKTTLNDIEQARSIAFKTDMQDQTGSINWQPVVRGFLQDDYFLWMRTFADTSPEARTGRKFSHVLLIHKNDLPLLTSIGELNNYLPKELCKEADIRVIRHHPAATPLPIQACPFRSRFNKAIHGLHQLTTYKNTIIWVGEQDYEEAVDYFWQVLLPQERFLLNAGIYFDTGEINPAKINFITVPESVESKFLNNGYCVIRKNDSYELKEIAEQFIAGEPEAQKRISTFQQVLEIRELSRTQAERLIIGINAFEQIDTLQDFKKLISLSHTVSEFAPEADVAKTFKQQLLSKIVLLIKNVSTAELFLLKNFQIAAFKDSQAQFQNSINEWLKHHLFDVIVSKQSDFTFLFKKLEQKTKPNWWETTIEKNLSVFLSKVTTNVAETVYHWLRFYFDAFNTIQSYIQSSAESENAFFEKLPESNSKSQLVAYRQFAIKKGWWKFHAALLLQEFAFEEALTYQLKVDTLADSLNGIKQIFHKQAPERILTVSVKMGDNRLLTMCGALCKAKPELLRNIDLADTNWLTIWSNAAQSGLPVDEGISQPEKTIYELFDNICGKKIQVPSVLLAKIAESSYADVLNYGKREQLWGHLPSTVLPRFLSTTANTLLQKIGAGQTPDLSDKVLLNYIAKEGIHHFIANTPDNYKAVFSVFNAINTLSEPLLVNYIQSLHVPVDAIEASQLGKMVYERIWINCTYAIRNKTTSNNEWRFALAECYWLLDFFSIGALKFSDILSSVNIPKEQFWKGLYDVLCDLYPNMNAITTVWTNAGGKESEIPTNLSAQDAWRELLHKLEKNGCKKITTKQLLDNIYKTYADNKNFKIIYDLKDKYI